MTKTELEYYSGLKFLIKALEACRQDYRSFITDPERLEELDRIILNQIRKRTEQQETVLKWLQSVEDPEIRQIIHYRYDLHLKWFDVNLKVYGGYTCEDYSRIRLERYLRNSAL